MYFIVLIVFSISSQIIYALPSKIEFKSDTKTNEVCKSGNGYMSLSDETKILTKFKNENGQNVIIAKVNDEKGLDEIFTFTCHKNHENNKTKIIFESEEPSDISEEASPIRRRLRNIDLYVNEIATNTEPYSVKCEDVCEVIFIVVEFDADVLCDDENNVKNWNCGIDQLEYELEPAVLRKSNYYDESIERSYQIKNPFNEEPSFYSCHVIDRNNSYIGLNSCVYVLEQLNFAAVFAPYKILVKIVENGKESYMTKLFYPKTPPKSDIPVISDEIKLFCIFLLSITIFLTIGFLCFYLRKKCGDKKGFRKLVCSNSIADDLDKLVPI